MTCAYNIEWLHNLEVVKEAKRWFKQSMIDAVQFASIGENYKSELYHPNFLIRILLFVASLLALSGITGLLALMIADADENVIFIACIIYGLISFFVLEKVFIQSNKHYKSGVTEALLYHACGFTLGGLIGLTDGEEHTIFVFSICIFTFTAIRYLDLVTTLAAFASLMGFIFYEFYQMGGIFRNIIPLVLIICFTPLYFYFHILKKNRSLSEWHYVITLVEALSLLLIYAAGNYFVVRELTLDLMDLYLEEGQDIPYAFLFYGLTILIPLVYLYFGIKNKDIVLLRVSLFVFAFSVFTFKYYYGFGHPEISLTIAGALLTGGTLALMNYLKIIRYGYTRENLLQEKWDTANIQAVLISQTMGGNEIVAHDEFKGGGGGFSGGGASGDY
jgi:hypothetical protein